MKLTKQGKLTINDVKQLRSDIGGDIAAEQALTAPNRRKLSALRDLDNALLDLMERGPGDESLATAIAQSRSKNKLFNQGNVGKVRGFDATGTPKVRKELTLKSIVQASIVTGKQFVL